MFFDEAHKVGRSIAGERRLSEVSIGRKKILRAGSQVGEIAAAATGDQDFLADSIRAFEYQNTPAPLAGFHGTHQAGSAASENDDVVFPIHAGMSLAGLASRPALRNRIAPLLRKYGALHGEASGEALVLAFAMADGK